MTRSNLLSLLITALLAHSHVTATKAQTTSKKPTAAPSAATARTPEAPSVPGTKRAQVKSPAQKAARKPEALTKPRPISPTLGLTFKSTTHLSLPKALRLAKQGNSDLRISAIAIAEAALKKSQSKKKLYPLIKVEANALFWNDKLALAFSLPDDLPIQIDMDPILVRKQWTVQSSITVAQPITPWFSLKALYDLDKAEIKARTMQLRIKEREIENKVKAAYYNCLKADSYLKVIAEAETMLAEQEKRLRLLLHEKLITDTELAKVLSAKAQVKAQKIKVIASTLLARQYLAYLIGVKLDSRLILTEPALHKKRPPSTEACTRVAMQKRPTFAFINLKKSQLEHAKRALSFDRLPRLLAVTQYKNSQGFGDFEPEHQWFVGLSLSWEFSWGGKKLALDKLSLKERELSLNREKARRGITLEIHKTHLEMLAARALIDAREEAVDAAKKSYDKLKIQLTAKYTTNAELLTARTELTKARVDLQSARYDYYLAKTTYLATCR